jgi:hypothetical protein
MRGSEVRVGEFGAAFATHLAGLVLVGNYNDRLVSKFTNERGAGATPAELQTQEEYNDFREKSRLLKVMRRTTETDPDPLMQFLEECDVDRCRHYHARHAELEAMGAVDRPLRIQLYDHLPELSPENARLVYSRIRQIEEMDPFSADGAKLSGWAHTVLSIPFGKRTAIEAPDGLSGVMTRLDAALYGQAAAKDAMLQAAAQMLACPTARPRVVALVGPPGVGKTTMSSRGRTCWATISAFSSPVGAVNGTTCSRSRRTPSTRPRSLSVTTKKMPLRSMLNPTKSSVKSHDCVPSRRCVRTPVVSFP